MVWVESDWVGSGRVGIGEGQGTGGERRGRGGEVEEGMREAKCGCMWRSVDDNTLKANCNRAGRMRCDCERQIQNKKGR